MLKNTGKDQLDNYRYEGKVTSAIFAFVHHENEMVWSTGCSVTGVRCRYIFLLLTFFLDAVWRVHLHVSTALAGSVCVWPPATQEIDIWKFSLAKIQHEYHGGSRAGKLTVDTPSSMASLTGSGSYDGSACRQDLLPSLLYITSAGLSGCLCF